MFIISIFAEFCNTDTVFIDIDRDKTFETGQYAWWLKNTISGIINKCTEKLIFIKEYRRTVGQVILKFYD